MGDAFAGRFSREFIKTVSQKLPNVKFRIMTNGILATKEIIQELNIEDKIEELDISVNAVKASTHRKIFRTNTAAFKQLLKNLEYLSSLKVSDFTLNFVICNYNYKEMKKFVKFCQKYNAKASFWEVRDYFHDMLETKYEDIAVHLPAHKNHKKFKKLLSSKVFDNTQIILSPIIKEIRSEAVEETKNSLWNKLFRGRIFG